MWGQFLQMQAWWLISDRGLPSVFDIGGVPTGMAAFDEPAASLPEGIRVDFHGAMPPEGALENFRRVGSEVGIKPIHLAGFTRAATS